MNTLDFNAIASNFSQALPGPVPAAEAASPVVLVPEPLSAALLGIALLARRPRR